MSVAPVPPGHPWCEVSDEGLIGYLGPFWTLNDGSTLELGFFVDARHTNRAGRLHGGMLTTVADRAMGMCARIKDSDRNHATISLNISYLDSAVPGEFVVARAGLDRETRDLCFLHCTLLSSERTLALVQGVWKKLR